MKYIIPIIMILILLKAYRNKVAVYSSFCEGVEKGMKTVIGIFPVILAISTAVGMMRESGLLELVSSLLQPLTDLFKIPTEVIPLALLRPVSGGGSLALLSDILKEYGTDTKIGSVASVIMGCTETTFYTLSVYFKNTRVKKNSLIIPAAVFGDIVAVLVGVAVSAMVTT